ncbi:MAG: hypothetical protein JNL13_14795 [Chitinophagaceae bacterium]|nr:hypothetical protein [Chitinophagaceae bacterium]
MKLQEILKKHKAISEYVRLTGGRVSATFTHQYLPLFYSSNSLDIVLQNIIMALLGNLLQHIGSLSLIKTISFSLPAARLVVSLSQQKGTGPLQKIVLQFKRSLADFPARRISLKPVKNNRIALFPAKPRYNSLFCKIRDTVLPPASA